MPKTVKMFWFDTETTGINPLLHSLTEVAVIYENPATHETAELYIKFQPRPGCQITQEALDVQGITMEELMSRIPYTQGYAHIVDFMNRCVDKYDKFDKMYPCGYNVKFDLDFLQQCFIDNGNKHGIGSYINWRRLDVLDQIYLMDYHGKISLHNYKLATVANYFGIPLIPHNANNDIIATRAIANKIGMV